MIESLVASSRATERLNRDLNRLWHHLERFNRYLVFQLPSFSGFSSTACGVNLCLASKQERHHSLNLSRHELGARVAHSLASTTDEIASSRQMLTLRSWLRSRKHTPEYQNVNHSGRMLTPRSEHGQTIRCHHMSQEDLVICTLLTPAHCPRQSGLPTRGNKESGG